MTKTLIHGRKGGGGSAHTPVEAPDDLQSNAKIKILLALSEGEIAGELDGTRILLDGTPVHNPDGSENFTGLKWEVRNGTQTQDYIQGMPDVESETPVNVKLTTTNVWTKTFTRTDIDALRIRMGFPALFQQEDNGDMNGSQVEYLIELSTDGGAYQTVVTGTLKGKTTSLYERDHRINLPKATTSWTLRIKRITPDSTSSKLVNTTQIQTYTEIVDAKFRYPNTALLFIEFDAQQFSSVPKITLKPKGKIIRVPANYDPLARTYSGNWDGSFKWAWSNNPAWVFYDIALDKNYGLGNRVTAAEIDKWGLYSIAQYCDELIDDGLGGGGKEPRFLCDVYIQSQQDAYTVLRDIAAIFRGITYWGNDQLFAYADMPRDVDFVYSRANVIGGEFAYASGSYKNRYTSALVKWGDPANHYADAVEAAYDNELVKRYGVNQTEITAIGCTRRTEAHRRGRWAILSNAKDRTVSFTVGLDGNIPLPARIIGIADAMLAGKTNGGRIHSAQDRVVVLDREVEFGKGDRLIVNLPDGTAQTRTIASIAADKLTVTLTAPFRQQPEPEAVWSIDSDSLAIQQFRVVSVQSNDDGTFAINAVEHDPDKYAFIDNGIRLDAPPITVTPPGAMPAPANIAISRYDYVSQGINVASMRVQWRAVAGAVTYEAQWRKDNGNWVNVGATPSLGFDVNGIYAGNYDVRVRAVNAVGVSSQWGHAEPSYLAGKAGAPPKIVSLTATQDVVFGIQLAWGFGHNSADGLKTTLMVASRADFADERLLADVPYPQHRYDMQGLRAGQVLYFRAAFTDKTGNQSDWSEFVRGMASDSADVVLAQIAQSITETELGKDLLEKINSLPSDQNVQDLAEKIAQAQADIEENRDALQGDVDTLQAALNKVNAELAGRNADLSNAVDVLQQDLTQLGKAAIENSLTIEHNRQKLSQAQEALNSDIKDARGEIDSTRASLARADAELQAKVDALTGDTNAAMAEVASQITQLQDDDQQLASKLDVVIAKAEGNAAQIAQEQAARVDADGALAKDISSVKTTADNQQGLIIKLEQAQADADSALAKVESNVSANAKAIGSNKTEQDKVNSQVTQKTEALADQQKTQGQQLSGLTSEFSENRAEVTQQLKTLAATDSAQAQQISGLQASTGSNTAAIQAEAKSRADADGALSQRVDVIQATSQENTAAITRLGITQTEAESSTASLQQALEATAKANIEQALKQDNDVQRLDESSARLTTAQTVFADRQQAQAQQITQLDANFGDVSAQLQQEITTRASETGALSQRFDHLSADVGSNQAEVDQRLQALVDSGSAQASLISGLGATSGENKAAIAAESQARTTADEALSRQLSSLDSTVGQNTAAINDRLQTLANQDSAMAEQIGSLTATSGENSAAIGELKQAQTDSAGSQASLSSSLEAIAKADIEQSLKQAEDVISNDVVTASIKTQQNVMADDQRAQAQQITELRASFGDVDARLMTEQTVRAEADKALSQQVTALEGTVGDNNAQLNQQLQVLVDTESAQAKLINDLTSRTGANEASVTALSQTLTDSNSATAQQIGALQSATGDNTSAITSLSKTVTDNQSATANDIKLLNTAVGDNKAAVQQVSSAQATLDGKVSATWSVKVETSKKGESSVAGLALGVDDAGNRQFLVRADRFALVTKDEGNVSVPFAVQNGQTFINSAFIADGTITNAKITGWIGSSNFVDGKQGWAIDKETGGAQFNQVSVRGNIYADGGYFKGDITGANGTFSGTILANKIVGDLVDTNSMPDVLSVSRHIERNSYVDIPLVTITASSFEKRGVIQGLLPNGLSHYPERGVSVVPGNVASVWGFGSANGSISLLLNNKVIAKSYRDYSANTYLPEIISSIPITIGPSSGNNQLVLRLINNGNEANWVACFLQCSIILSRSTQNIIFNNVTN
ncbi:TipJ family phage tail tip protein [Serratia fonticola]|uniref:TipJ family phage tail tip protein n=1 Tax=Serratia fonticola TaxID=47917 RepID=UPI0034C6A516